MRPGSDRAVRRWLIASATAVGLAVVVGGITRLTESGLSITEWRPVSGVLPPITHRDWAEAYQRYLAIPEARTVHRGISLGQFQALFWWEWIHRLLARLVGLVLAVPYLVLLARGAIRPAHRRRLLLLPVLALAQGALGWYMVKSGLQVRTDVSPYRLAAHLGMALVIYLISIWTALDLEREAPAALRARSPMRGVLIGAAGLTFLTLLSGAFVAGLDAGRVYNTFPLMAGKLVPPGYWLPDLGWRNPFENPAAAQFHHRILAVGTALFLLTLAWRSRRQETPEVRRATGGMALLVLIQVGLGITTLLLAVPVLLGVLHQATGLLVLTAVVVAAHRAGGVA